MIFVFQDFITMSHKWNPDLYNDKHSFVYSYGKDLIDILKPQTNERILDVGCGSGQLTYQISQNAKQVIGIDKSPEMIADAKSKYSQIDFQVEDASDFHFDKPFDAVFSNAALHWVKDYENVIKCMYKCLGSHGRMVVEFGGKGNIETILRQLKKSLNERGYLEQSRLEPWFFPSIGEYTSALEKQGFHVSFAQLYERPTELADKDTGIKDWLAMFASQFFENLDSDTIETIKNEVQEKIKSECLKNEKWYADYKRIQVVAFKQA